MWMGRRLMLLSQSSFQQCMTVEFVTVNSLPINGCQFRPYPLSEKHYFTCATKNCCVQKLQPHDKSKVVVSPNTQSLYIRCSGLAWLCRDRDKLITMRRMIWNPRWLMKKEMYNGMLQNLVYSNCETNVIYQMEHFNMNLVKQQPHMQTAAKIDSICICTLHFFLPVWDYILVSSPYSSLAMDHSLWLFVVYCCFCLYFGCSSYSANCIGECCESVP